MNANFTEIGKMNAGQVPAPIRHFFSKGSSMTLFQKLKSMRQGMLLGVFAMVCALLATQAAIAQGYGSISGTVTDGTGAVIPDAEVTATQTSTGVALKTTSNAEGTYTFPSLAPSVYSISASHAGFAAFYEAGLEVRADASVTANVSLKAGSETETVTVNAEAVQVDTTTGTLSQVIGTSQVNELPLNGRNVASLTTLVAGAVTAPNANTDQGTTKTFPVVVPITANGTRVGQTNYLLDGGNNVDEYTNVNAPFPMPDALQEFSLQTSNYNAEYGQNAGGVVNIVTKSGSNKYHGDLFEYVRNRVFNAANYFSFVNGEKVVDPLKRNQFGGTFGGPVSVPHLFRSDKSFFFFGYQKTISHDIAANSTAATLPTAAQRAGNFAFTTPAGITPASPTFTSYCVKNPISGACYPYTANGGTSYTSQVPLNSYDPASAAASQAVLSHLPTGDANGNFIFRKPNIQNLSEYTGRFDQQVGSKDHIMAHYFYDSFNLGGVLDLTDLLTYQDTANITYHNAVIADTHTFSDHLLNNFIISYQHENSGRGPVSGAINMNDLGVNIWQPSFKQINEIQVGGTSTNSSSAFFDIGDNPTAIFLRNNYTLAEDLHWELRNHEITVGFHGEVSKLDINNDYRQPGLFQFDANGTNSAFASFLLGYMADLQQASGQFFNARGKFLGGYAQDSWKVNRRLTLNYGVRYEPFIPWHEMQGRMGGFSPSLYAAGTHSTLYPNAPAGLLFAGDPGFNADGVPHIYTHFMPRVGFAWDVMGTGKTSLRGGSGMFYDSRMSASFFNIFSNNSPFITNAEVKNVPFANPYVNTVNPFPAPQPPASSSAVPFQSFLTYDPTHGFQTPLMYAWNLALEQQVTGSLLARIAYVGTHGSHQWEDIELNPVYTAASAPTPAQVGLRVYQPAQLGTAGCTTLNCYPNAISEANTGGNTSYNSLQTSIEQRMKYGLTILANYTWSKALDDLPLGASATAVATNTSYVYPTYIPNFKGLDHGPSAFDHRNVASISYIYALPHTLKDAPAVVRYAINGWETTGLVQYRSGDSLTPTSGATNVSGTGQNQDRAVVVAGVNAYGGSPCATPTAPCVPFLNSAAFTTPADGGFGTVQKGSYIGPRYTDWDASLARKFNLTEVSYLQFRAEFFDVLNHTNFLDPNTSAGGSSFGRITGSNDPRIGQLSLKLVF